VAAVTRRILEFLEHLGEAVVDERRPAAHGTALLTPSLPLVWQLNVLRAEDPEADAAGLAAEAELLFGTLAHRKVLVYDEERGAALAPGFRALGWNVFRLILMVRTWPPERPPPPGAGGEISRASGARAIQAFRREQPFGWQDEALRQLAEMDERFGRATATGRDFGAPPDDPACACRLYVNGRIGQVEEVGTVEARRGHGHGSAAVLAAADAARADGCELVFLTTDGGDWPQHWYRRLGFEEAGAYYEFLKLPLG